IPRRLDARALFPPAKAKVRKINSRSTSHIAEPTRTMKCASAAWEGTDSIGRISCREHRRGAPDNCALDDIAQLSNVSRPRVSSEGIQAVLAHVLDSLLVFPIEFLDEVLDEQRQILEPV